MLFAADAPRKAANPMFELKLALVAIAVAVMAVIERRLLLMELGASSGDVQRGFRVLAAASLLIWAAAIAAGRLVAYALSRGCRRPQASQRGDRRGFWRLSGARAHLARKDTLAGAGAIKPATA
jgi:hypothetical protein